jgi:predicted dehydrogenase
MMNGPQRRILIVGTGSVGRRHARNLASLGATVACFDPRPDRRLQAREELGPVDLFDDLDRAFASSFAGVVIASPPSFHVDQAITCLQRALPVLLEKPVAPDLAAALRLQQAMAQHPVPVLLGYTYRWWPPLLHLRARIQAKPVGPLRHARFVMSAHLADWHPWERYQDFFMASRELGGGALLDESHFIDLMHWFFGMPEAVAGSVEHLSALEITTDDNVDLIARYRDGLRVTIHLDLFGRPHQKSITVVGEDGTLECLFEPNLVRESVTGRDVVTTAFSCERNDMFLAEAREFLEVLEGRGGGTCAVADGVDTLRTVEAVRRSSAEGRTIGLVAS